MLLASYLLCQENDLPASHHGPMKAMLFQFILRINWWLNVLHGLQVFELNEQCETTKHCYKTSKGLCCLPDSLIFDAASWELYYGLCHQQVLTRKEIVWSKKDDVSENENLKLLTVHTESDNVIGVQCWICRVFLILNWVNKFLSFQKHLWS